MKKINIPLNMDPSRLQVKRLSAEGVTTRLLKAVYRQSAETSWLPEILQVAIARPEGLSNNGERAHIDEMLRCYSMGRSNYMRAKELCDQNDQLAQQGFIAAKQAEALEQAVERLEDIEAAIATEIDCGKDAANIIPEIADLFSDPDDLQTLHNNLEVAKAAYVTRADRDPEFRREIMAARKKIDLAFIDIKYNTDEKSTYSAERGSVAQALESLRDIEKRCVRGMIDEIKANAGEMAEKIARAREVVDDFAWRIDLNNHELVGLFDSNGGIDCLEADMKYGYSVETRREMLDEFAADSDLMLIYGAYVEAAEASKGAGFPADDALFFKEFYSLLKGKVRGIDFPLAIVEDLKKKKEEVYLFFKANNLPKRNEDGSPLSLDEIFRLEDAPAAEGDASPRFSEGAVRGY